MKTRFNKKLAIATLITTALAATQASAALPTEATDAITAIQTDGTAMISAGWPVVVAIFGGLVIIKLFKKVLSRAT